MLRPNDFLASYSNLSTYVELKKRNLGISFFSLSLESKTKIIGVD